MLIACLTPHVNAVQSRWTHGKYSGLVWLKEKIILKVLHVLEARHGPWGRLRGPRAIKTRNDIYLQYIDIIFQHPKGLLPLCHLKYTALQSLQSEWTGFQRLLELPPIMRSLPKRQLFAMAGDAGIFGTQPNTKRPAHSSYAIAIWFMSARF